MPYVKNTSYSLLKAITKFKVFYIRTIRYHQNIFSFTQSKQNLSFKGNLFKFPF